MCHWKNYSMVSQGANRKQSEGRRVFDEPLFVNASALKFMSVFHLAHEFDTRSGPAAP